MINQYDNIYFTANFMDLSVMGTGEPVSHYSESERHTFFTDYADRPIFVFDRIFQTRRTHCCQDIDFTRDQLSDLPGSAAKAVAYDNAAELWDFSFIVK